MLTFLFCLGWVLALILSIAVYGQTIARIRAERTAVFWKHLAMIQSLGVLADFLVNRFRK